MCNPTRQAAISCALLGESICDSVTNEQLLYSPLPTHAKPTEKLEFVA
jgi:hypothetical protein